MNSKPKVESMILFKGHGAAVLSFPLPKDHWIFKDSGEPPASLYTDDFDARMQMESMFKEAAKYAIRASTRSGKDTDFDPDAMVQNLMVALFGYYSVNYPRETTKVQRKLPNGKLLTFVMSKVKE